MQLAAFNVL